MAKKAGLVSRDDEVSPKGEPSHASPPPGTPSAEKLIKVRVPEALARRAEHYKVDHNLDWSELVTLAISHLVEPTSSADACECATLTTLTTVTTVTT